MLANTRAWLLKQRDGHGRVQPRAAVAAHVGHRPRVRQRVLHVGAAGDGPDRAGRARSRGSRPTPIREANTYAVALAANSLFLAGDHDGAKRLMDRLAKAQVDRRPRGRRDDQRRRVRRHQPGRGDDGSGRAGVAARPGLRRPGRAGGAVPDRQRARTGGTGRRSRRCWRCGRSLPTTRPGRTRRRPARVQLVVDDEAGAGRPCRSTPRRAGRSSCRTRRPS